MSKNNEAKIAAAIAKAEADIHATSVVTQTNSAAVENIGHNAVARWTEGAKQTKAGDACAIYALLCSQFTITFDAIVTRKKEDTSEAFSFDMADVEKDWANADGTNDRLKKGAAQTAIAQRLFGLAEMDNAQKQAIFQRCVPTACYVLRSLPAVKTLEALQELVTLETVDGIEMLSLPRFLVAEPPKEDASKNEVATYEALKNIPIQLDGKQGNSVTTLRERARPPRQPKAPVAPVDAGKSLLVSVKMVSDVLKGWNNPEAEAEVAVTEEMRQQLFALAQEIAAYFTHDPIEALDDVAAA